MTMRRPQSGLTLVELLVAMAITLSLLGGVMVIALSSRRIYELDQERTAVNQNLRAGMDLLGLEVRQAGERLPGDVPALEIVDGAPESDTLVVRRNISDVVLPVCIDLPAGSTGQDIWVAETSAPVPPGCAPVADGDADGWPDNLQAWRDQRLAAGGTLRAYIYDPASQAGEFFDYTGEDAASHRLLRSSPAPWSRAYTVADNARIYILEQSVFVRQDDVLQRIVNDDTASPLNLVNRVENFQVRAFLRDGSILTDLDAGDPWPELRSVEVTLVGRGDVRDGDIRRVLTSQYFPRNVLSR